MNVAFLWRCSYAYDCDDYDRLGQYVCSFDCDKTIYTCKSILTIYWGRHRWTQKKTDQELNREENLTGGTNNRHWKKRLIEKTKN